MRNLWLWVVVLVAIIGGLAWWWQATRVPVMSPMDLSAAGAVAEQSASSTVLMNATVTYNGSSFLPQTVTIAHGGTITFTSTGPQMWVASDPHPNHDGYDGNAQSVHCATGYPGPAPFDECVAGTSFVFTFNKSGTWGYHDHLNDDVGGTVIVQ